jgi:electron transfer flavoprotein beta subunit
MNLLVFIAHVPDTETKVRIAADGVHIDETGVNLAISTYDEYAVEESLRLKEKNAGSKVTVATVGGDKSKDSLVKALAMGADEAVLVNDPAAEDSDSLGGARILAAIAKSVPHDLILMGMKAVGSDSGQAGAMLAELLDIPCVNVVVKLEVAGTALTAHREIEGAEEIVTAPLPAIVTCQKGLNEPRYPKLQGIMAAKKKPIAMKKLADLGIDAATVGKAGAKAKVVKLELPAPRAAGQLLTGDPAEAVSQLVKLLHEQAKVI